jgi:hypothetical protein
MITYPELGEDATVDTISCPGCPKGSPASPPISSDQAAIDARKFSEAWAHLF